MMKIERMIAVLLSVFLVDAAAGSAQETDIDIRGTLSFTAVDTAVSKSIYKLTYGVGTLYTDSTDRIYEEMIPPFVPPGDFVIAFDRVCAVTDLVPPCWWKQDLRGIPDSVAMGGIDQFALTYSIVIESQTGVGFRLSIDNSEWPLGVDSVKVVDHVVPREFTRVFTGPAVETIENPDTWILDVTVYYNLRTLSVEREAVLASSLAIAPNPLRGEKLSLRGRFIEEDRVVLVDLLGRVIGQMAIVESQELIAWDVNLSSGVYHVLHFDRKGRVRGRRTLNVNR